MPYDHWWPPFHLAKMSDYYYMGRKVTKNGRYDFEFIWIKVRRRSYYIQREHKGKWRH